MKNIYHLFLLIIIASCNSDKEVNELKFEPFSTSTIHLILKKSLTDTIDVKAYAHTIIPYGTTQSELLRIKNEGNYYLTLKIDRPAKSHLEIGNDEYNVLFLPNDTSRIELNPKQSKIEINFSGPGSSINAYYLERKNSFRYTDIIRVFGKTASGSSTYNSIKNAVDSIANRELIFLKNYKASHSLPKWFLDYERAEIIYSSAGYKVTRPSRNSKVKLFEDTLPHDYYNFMNNIEVDNSNAIFSSIYFLFLDGYFLKDYPIEKVRKLSRLESLKLYNEHIIDQSKIRLSGKVRDVYRKKKFTQAVRLYSDISQIDSLAESFQLSDYSSLIPHLKKGDVIMDFTLKNELDSIVSFRAFKDQVLYINFWSTSCRPCIERIPDLNKMIKNFKNDQRVAFINICLDSEKDQYNSILKKYNIDGINVCANYNQSTKLKNHFNFSGFPNYVLVDKGNILLENHTDKAPIVQNKIEKLLE